MAHPDLDELLNVLLPFAQQMLSKHGEYFPFGASMSSDGKISFCGAYDGGEQPESKTLIDLMTGAFRAQAEKGEIRATGICFDIRDIPPGQTEKTDAICACLEHESAEAVNLCVPYKKGWFGKIKYGELFGCRPDPKIFIKK